MNRRTKCTLTALLAAQAQDGVIAIPKEYGLFEASLPR